MLVEFVKVNTDQKKCKWSFMSMKILTFRYRMGREEKLYCTNKKTTNYLFNHYCMTYKSLFYTLFHDVFNCQKKNWLCKCFSDKASLLITASHPLGCLWQCYISPESTYQLVTKSQATQRVQPLWWIKKKAQDIRFPSKENANSSSREAIYPSAQT